MADTTNTLADRLSAELFYVELKRGKSLRRTFADKAGRAMLAQATNSDESSLTISRKLFPKGFDHFLKDADAAVNDLTDHFHEHTIHADFHGDPTNTKTRAKSRKFIRSPSITAGTVITESNHRRDEAERKGKIFADALPGLINAIEASGVLGSAFNREAYPHPDDVAASYTFVPIEETIEPVPSSASIPVTSASMAAVQKAYEASLETKYRFGMQRAASELGKSLKTVADNLRAHVEWETTPEYLREEKLGRKKAPRLSSTLFPNVQTAVSRLKEFVIPDTEDAQAIYSLIEEVEASIQPDQQSPDSIRSSVHIADKVAGSADQLSEALEELDFF